METSFKKRNMLNELIAGELQKKEDKKGEEFTAELLDSIRQRQERWYNYALKEIQEQHSSILQYIDEQIEEMRTLRLRLPLKKKYMEMEKKNIQMEVRHKWKSTLSKLLKACTEEGNE